MSCNNYFYYIEKGQDKSHLGLRNGEKNEQYIFCIARFFLNFRKSRLLDVVYSRVCNKTDFQIFPTAFLTIDLLFSRLLVVEKDIFSYTQL